MTTMLTTTTAPAPSEETTVGTPTVECPLTAGTCTVEVCVNLNDPVAQANCSLC